jgi:protein gp37
MCDWAEDHPTAAAIRPRLWDLIRRTPFLTWQLLTKRADRIYQCLPRDWDAGWPNVWLGVSVSEQKGLWRVDELRKVPAVVRFISYEPALEDITSWLHLGGIHWIIFGGESGPGHRAPAGWQGLGAHHARAVPAQSRRVFLQTKSGRAHGDGHTTRR